MNSTTDLTKSDELQNLRFVDKDVIAGISNILCDTMVLHAKVLNFHWNIEGENFFQIHEETEKMYNNLHEAADDLAERIRMLGYYAPGSFAEYLDNSKIEEAIGQPVSPRLVIEILYNDQITLINRIQECLELDAIGGDHTTEDLLNQRKAYHEEKAWMFRSYLK